LLSDYYPRAFVPSRLGASPDSLRQYTYAISVWQRFLCQPPTLDDLNDSAVRAFLAAYLTSGVTPATVNSKRRHILSLWRFALDEHAVVVGLGEIHRAPEELAEPEAWTAAEVQRLLSEATAAGPWWQSLIEVLLWTGERISAVRRCTPADLASAGLLVRRRKTHRGRGPGKFKPKSTVCSAAGCCQ
jgi:integrase